MYVCMYVCIYVCMYACMYVYIYACMHVCMYLCMYVRMYAYLNSILSVDCISPPNEPSRSNEAIVCKFSKAINQTALLYTCSVLYLLD